MLRFTKVGPGLHPSACCLQQGQVDKLVNHFVWRHNRSEYFPFLFRFNLLLHHSIRLFRQSGFLHPSPFLSGARYDGVSA